MNTFRKTVIKAFITKIILATFACFILDSCGNKVNYDVSYIPCESDENVGFLDPNGVFTPMESVENDLTPVINNYFMADGNIYMVDREVTDTTNVIFRDVKESGIMSDGLMPVCKEFEHISIIDEKGKVQFQLITYDDKDVKACYSFSSSKLRVLLEDDSYIFVGKDGKKLFDKSFSWATDFKNDRAVVQLESQNNNLYSLVDENSTPIFTFESEDEDYISVSFELELLCAKENNKIVIYDFEGKRILECPTKVDNIYKFCGNGFIYRNDDEEFGFMSYHGEVIISAKYERLVSHGENFLAILDTSDDEIDLIDIKDNIIKRFNGDEIIDFSLIGFDFPNIIVDNDENYTLINEKGEVLAEDLELELFEDLEFANRVVSDYVPKDKVIDILVGLCNNGNGISSKYGAFLHQGHNHCYPKDISFLNSLSVSHLTAQYSAGKQIDTGLNYAISYYVKFDEPIIKSGEYSLNNSAWLNEVEIGFELPDLLSSVIIRNIFMKKMIELGCVEYFRHNGAFMLESSDKNYIYTIVPAKGNSKEFRIIVCFNTSSNVAMWMNYMRTLK